MRKSFTVSYILMVVAQMLFTNYFQFTPLCMITILPLLALCVPTKVDTPLAMVIAFATGLAVDIFAEGAMGINALSLVPVALVRKGLVGMIFGPEPFERQESISVNKYGFARMSFAVILVTALFLAIYITVDCAGARPFWFMAAKFGISLLASVVVSAPLVNFLSYDDRK